MALVAAFLLIDISCLIYALFTVFNLSEHFNLFFPLFIPLQSIFFLTITLACIYFHCRSLGTFRCCSYAVLLSSYYSFSSNVLCRRNVFYGRYFVLEMAWLWFTHTVFLANVLVLCTFPTFIRSKRWCERDTAAGWRCSFQQSGLFACIVIALALHLSAAPRPPRWSTAPLCCPAPPLPDLTPEACNKYINTDNGILIITNLLFLRQHKHSVLLSKTAGVEKKPSQVFPAEKRKKKDLKH